MLPGRYSLTLLQSALLKTLVAAHFDQTLDYGPGNEERPAHHAMPLARMPNVDVAVIQLDAQGGQVAAAEVILSQDYPAGLVVPLDPDRGATTMRFIPWNQARWDGGAGAKPGWTNSPPSADTGQADGGAAVRHPAALEFMSPYPASLFKIMVAFHVLRMVDAGRLKLDTPCAAPAALNAGAGGSVRDCLAAMITVSDNRSTAALLKLMHAGGEVARMNGELRQLNLATLQVNGTSPATGQNWQPGRIQMTAYDTARLFRIIAGGRGVFWRGADGAPVTEQWLSPASRTLLKSWLADQAFNEELSTANFPGAPGVVPGIPCRVSARWIDPKDGHVRVEQTDYGVDIRAANARATVEFAHKTGLTFNFSSDAGIVTSLPGQVFRRYIIVFLSNLGYRYTDAREADADAFPALRRVSPVICTQRIPAWGRAVDELMGRLAAGPAHLP